MSEAQIKITGDIADIKQKLAQLGVEFKQLPKDAGAASEGITAKLESVIGAATTLKGMITLVSGVFSTAFVAGAISAVKESAEFAERLDQLSQRTGISIDTFQQYGAVLAQHNVSTETFALGIKTLGDNMQQARNPTSEAAQAFEELGLAITGTESTDDVLRMIADRVAVLPDGFEKTALMTQLLGRAGSQLIPVFNDGAAALDRAREESERLGTILSQRAVTSLKEADDAFDRLKEASDGFVHQVGALLAPAVTSVTNFFTEAVASANHFARALTGDEKAWESFVTTVLKLTPGGFPEVKLPGVSVPKPEEIPAETLEQLEADKLFRTPEEAEVEKGQAQLIKDLVAFRERELELKLFSNAEGQKGFKIVADTLHQVSAEEKMRESMSLLDEGITKRRFETQQQENALWADRLLANKEQIADQQELHGIYDSQLEVLVAMEELRESGYREPFRITDENFLPTQLGRAQSQNAITERTFSEREDKTHEEYLVRLQRAQVEYEKAVFQSNDSIFKSNESVVQESLRLIDLEEKQRLAAIERMGLSGQDKFTEQLIIEREFAAKRIAIHREFPTFWDQQLKAIQDSAVFVWGNITTQFSSSVAQWAVYGKSFETVWQGALASLLQAAINTFIQMGVRSAAHLLSEETNSATLLSGHQAMETAKTSATVAEETARSGMVAAETQFQLTEMNTTMVGMQGIGQAMLSMLGILSGAVTAFLSAAGAAAMAIPGGQGVGAKILAASAQFTLKTSAAMTAAEAGLAGVAEKTSAITLGGGASGGSGSGLGSVLGAGSSLFSLGGLLGGSNFFGAGGGLTNFLSSFGGSGFGTAFADPTQYSSAIGPIFGSGAAMGAPDMWTIPGLNASFLPDFAFFADGGVAMKPLLGMVAEAGPEAMIPLDRLDGIVGRGSRGPTTIIFQADRRELARAVIEELPKVTRLQLKLA
ncbi:hypothetical protein [Candidatus Nitrospira bockiana]